MDKTTTIIAGVFANLLMIGALISLAEGMLGTSLVFLSIAGIFIISIVNNR